MKTTTIQKWGNSYAIRLPKASIEKLKLREGKIVSVIEDTETSGLRIIPITKKPETLKSLVEAISEHNKQGEVDWGKPHGQEIW